MAFGGLDILRGHFMTREATPATPATSRPSAAVALQVHTPMHALVAQAEDHHPVKVIPSA